MVKRSTFGLQGSSKNSVNLPGVDPGQIHGLLEPPWITKLPHTGPPGRVHDRIWHPLAAFTLQKHIPQKQIHEGDWTQAVVQGAKTVTYSPTHTGITMWAHYLYGMDQSQWAAPLT